MESVDEDIPTVTLRGGEVLKADLVIGADGNLRPGESSS
jgi:2-polyprenyl-6-methoxyphenol hydroxylase-like FAD-dependent oxidoreductase